MKNLRSWDVLPRKPDRERYRKLFGVPGERTSRPIKGDSEGRRWTTGEKFGSPASSVRSQIAASPTQHSVPMVVTQQPLLELSNAPSGSIDEQLALYEQAIIVKAILDSRYCISGAARRLQIGRGSLCHRMKRLGIHIEHRPEAEAETVSASPG